MQANNHRLIELCNVTKTYRRDSVETTALSDITLNIHSGEFLLIKGKSGSGKTTLLNLIGCLDYPTSGTVKIKGTDTSGAGEKQLAQLRSATIGFIFQNLSLRRKRPVLENVMLPLLLRNERLKTARTRALDTLQKLGLAAQATKHVEDLSGGQAQRVAIARAIVDEPEILLADEPTGNLDTEIGKDMLELLIDFPKKQGRTLVLVTHDQYAQKFADRIITLDDGKISHDLKTGG